MHNNEYPTLPDKIPESEIEQIGVAGARTRSDLCAHSSISALLGATINTVGIIVSFFFK